MRIPTNDDQLLNLAHNLTVLRQRNRLSLKAMADILHTTPYVLRMLEHGEISTHFDVDSIFYARRHFQITFHELFDTRL